MNIFNSLGSNYDFKFVWKTLFAFGSSNQLIANLEDRFQGKAALVYKGREAIELALKLLDLPEGSAVAINGFTCYAVYKAIVDAGLIPVYLDVPENQLNFTPQTLASALTQNSKIKAVIIQNTLGYPADIIAIKKHCTQHNLRLIEDLAHSVGSLYSDQTPAGTVGDLTILSFSQDKIIDAVSGGALIIRHPELQSKTWPKFANIKFKQQLIDRSYPLFTWLIRQTYPIWLGKVLHSLLKQLKWLSQPMTFLSNSHFHQLAPWYAQLAEHRFQTLDSNLTHRRQIAQIYAKQLDPSIQLPNLTELISSSTNLRYPILVQNRASLIHVLKKSGVYVSDIWYDAPIAPKKYMTATNYDHQAPHAEALSEVILNLPTHQNIDPHQARQIAQIINQWLKSA